MLYANLGGVSEMGWNECEKTSKSEEKTVALLKKRVALVKVADKYWPEDETLKQIFHNYL